MGSGIVHHKSDRKPCVIPTADRNSTVYKYSLQKINVDFSSFLGVRIILTFQFEQAISSDQPTHPNFNFVRI